LAEIARTDENLYFLLRLIKTYREDTLIH